MTAFVANPNMLRVWLTDEITEEVINDADVAVTLRDKKTGTALTGMTWPLTIPHVADNGLYRVIFDNDISFVAGKKVVAVVDATISAEPIGHWEFEFTPQVRRF